MGTSIAFGAYDPLSPVPLTTTGMLQYRCSRGQPIRITFTAGSSGDVYARTLRQGPWTLAYNLYADAGFGTVWGDGTAAAPAVTTLSNGLTVAYVFGRIPARQEPPVGPYSDTIVVTFEF